MVDNLKLSTNFLGVYEEVAKENYLFLQNILSISKKLAVAIKSSASKFAEAWDLKMATVPVPINASALNPQNLKVIKNRVNSYTYFISL